MSHVPQAGFSSAIAHVLLLSRCLDTEPFAAPFDQRGNCTTSTWFQTAAFPNEFSRRNHSMRTVCGRNHALRFTEAAKRATAGAVAMTEPWLSIASR